MTEPRTKELRSKPRIRFLLAEAQDGPWWPERKADLWLTNAAGDSLLVDAVDVADLLNARLAAPSPAPTPDLDVELLRRALYVLDMDMMPVALAAEYRRLAAESNEPRLG